MNYFIDVFHLSLNKFGEELCGDQMEMVDTEDSKIIVLSDGLGSGVKANILATLTAKIAVTMLKEKASLEDTLETIIKTLPVCSIRKLSYSTFTIIKAFKDGTVHIVEFDNPSFFFLREGRHMEVEKKRHSIYGKIIHESVLKMKPSDYLMVVSDGVVHAGVGKLLNLGWKWDDIRKYVENLSKVRKSAGLIVHEIIGFTNILYDFMPGDDATVFTLTMKEKKKLHLFTGPPRNPADDQLYIEAFGESEGIKVIAGGTTANLIAKGIRKPLVVDIEGITKEHPPIATLEGADLVTEGILTIGEVIDILNKFKTGNASGIVERISGKNGPSRLSKLLIEEATEVVIWMGTAINPAHQEGGFRYDYNLKISQINKLKTLLEGFGKEVTLLTI